MNILKFLLLIVFINNYLFSKNLYWYVGSAFIKPAREISRLYKNRQIVLIPGGSQILLQKIILSKKGDIYLPGAEYYKKIAIKKGIVLRSTDLIKQIPVFALSKRGKKKVKNFHDLCKKNIKIALGNLETMALGRIYKKIEEKMPLNISQCIEKNSIIKGNNVSQIASYINMNIVDAGITFDSVAKVFHFKIIKIPEKYLVTDNAPLILLNFSEDRVSSKKFYNFIISHKYIFEKYGYKTCF